MKYKRKNSRRPHRWSLPACFRFRFCLCLCFCFGLLLPVAPPAAAEQPATANAGQDKVRIYAERQALFEQYSAATGIPWYELAAIDQYERTMNLAHPKTRPMTEGLIEIRFSAAQWAGPLNPDPNDRQPASIAWYNGLGKDGSGDGLADRNNESDVLYSMCALLLEHGVSDADFPIALWEHYQNSRSVQRIMQFSKIYAAAGTLNLDQHAFPLPLGSNYSFRSTWGARRSWGGYRIHEGTDLFAGYGLPVRSTSYGAIEVMGWNRYGGWRIGVRDIHNVYHYFAHLTGFRKGLHKGDLVKPGETIGWVGNSGYGKPGTQGKFPPHLHYGLYRDSGLSEWPFDPYPYLKKWEKEERSRSQHRLK